MGSISLDANSKFDDIFKRNDTASAQQNQLLSKRILEQNLTLQSHQDLQKDDKSEQLLFANLNILGLIETNEVLKRQNKDYEFKLSAVINKSAKVMEAYENDLTAKTVLIDLYKANDEACRHEYQEHVNELEDGIIILRQFLCQTLDMCDALESELSASKEKHQKELESKEKIIAMLEQELMHTTDLSKAVEKETKNNQKDKHVSIPYEENRCSKRHQIKQMLLCNKCSYQTKDDDNCIAIDEDNRCSTLREIYTQCRTIEKDIQYKKREYDELEMQLKNLFEKMKVLFNPTDANCFAKVDQHQLLADMITNFQEIIISECNLHLDVHESKITNENEYLLDTDMQPIVLLKKMNWRNGETLHNVDGFHTKKELLSTLPPSNRHYMMFRPKKRPRTDVKSERIIYETITLSDDETSDEDVSSGKENYGDEISSGEEHIVCIEDDDDCVLVTGPTQAELLRAGMVNFPDRGKRSRSGKHRSIRVRAIHGRLRRKSFDI